METAEKLKRHYDRLITLWQKKHMRMRQNMIFATIKVVKSWDFQQYISMEKEQRIAIRRALNEDSDKLIQVRVDFFLGIQSMSSLGGHKFKFQRCPVINILKEAFPSKSLSLY